jgi:ABC-type Fe3+ transport system substrate-binding protein
MTDATDTLEESRTLDELHEAARAEGGTLTVYAGGDFAGQQDQVLEAFTQAFPDIELNMIVDYSKYHDVRIDRQIEAGTLVADVTQLQTSFDFPRWQRLGRLRNYKPVGFSRVHDLFKDPEGAWVAVAVYAFSYMYGTEGGPAGPRDLVNPEWKGQITSSHPGDDDATLFLYKKYVDTYGWEWLEALARQDVTFRRGTNSPGDAVDAGTSRVGVAGAHTGSPKITWVTPGAGDPFLAWGQRAALLHGAPHPEAAKLYLNWMLSPQMQAAGFNGWGVRTDVVAEAGPIWSYDNAHVAEFYAFMEDRAEVERWRQSMNVSLGEVHGEPTPGSLGFRPTRHA